MPGFLPPTCPNCRTPFFEKYSHFCKYRKNCFVDSACSICKENFSTGDIISNSCPNDHVFHESCFLELIDRTPSPWALPDGCAWINSVWCHSHMNPKMWWNSVTKKYYKGTFPNLEEIQEKPREELLEEQNPLSHAELPSEVHNES